MAEGSGSCLLPPAAADFFLLQQNLEFAFLEFWPAENFLAQRFLENAFSEFCCSRKICCSLQQTHKLHKHEKKWIHPTLFVQIANYSRDG
jgi:hypothetical protein